MPRNIITIIILSCFSAFHLSGQCPSDITVTADANELCAGGSVTLSIVLPQGYEDNKLTVLSWWYTNNPSNPSSWNSLSLTTQTVQLDNRTSTLSYRAYVQYEGCVAVYTEYATVTVWTNSVGGTLAGAAEVCQGNNSGTITLSGHNGTVQSWYKRDATDPDWVAVSNTTATLDYSNLPITTRYRVEVRSGVCAAAYSSEATVTVHPNPTASFSASLTCDGATTRFTNSSGITSGYVASYQWSFGDGSQSTQTNPVKQYYNVDTYQVTLVAVSDKNCRGEITDPVTVHPNPVAGFSFVENCEDAESRFTNTSTVRSGEGLSYIWDFGDGRGSVLPSPGHIYDEAGTYRVKLVTVTSTGQCKDSVSMDFTVFPLPNASAGNDTTISAGKSVMLDGSGGVSYTWFPATWLSSYMIANPVATPHEDIQYELTVTDANGCVNKSVVNIFVENDYTIHPYNIITPDGNGENDTWIIEHIEHYSDARVRILNRWGEEVFFSKNYSNAGGWNGRNKNGDVLPEGTYYYIITFEGGDKLYKGAITLLRR